MQIGFPVKLNIKLEDGSWDNCAKDSLSTEVPLVSI